MMKSKKRKKSTRFRGLHTAQRGAKKKARGKGHRGGVGKAGSGKRADQKKTLFINNFKGKYFGKSKTLRNPAKKKLTSINLRDIESKFKGREEITLKGFKILGEGLVSFPIKITASAASKSAIDKVKKTGGGIIII